MGGLFQFLLGSPGAAPEWEISAGQFVAILGQLEQQPLFNAVNFDVNIWNMPNTTVSAIGVALLWCPSDADVHWPQILPNPSLGDMTGQTMNYTSYAGNNLIFLTHDSSVHRPAAPERLADVRDGLSRTIMFGERSHTALVSSGNAVAVSSHWWTSGQIWDTRFAWTYPPNAFLKYPPTDPNRVSALQTGASSQHSGGANFALADGSVRFLKDTISSWQVGAGPDWQNHPGAYQFLMTPNDGEIVSDDSY